MSTQGYIPPGGYVDHDREADEMTDRRVQGRVLAAPPPGTEFAGPPLTELVQRMSEATQALHGLYAAARADNALRVITFSAQFQLDANGDGFVQLAQVPQGSEGFLMHCCVDEAGVTPSNPDTSADLFMGIYGGPSGQDSAAHVEVVGNLLDAMPNSPTVNAQIPFTFLYASEWSVPTLRGPQAFLLAVDAGTASRMISVRGSILTRSER